MNFDQMLESEVLLKQQYSTAKMLTQYKIVGKHSNQPAINFPTCQIKAASITHLETSLPQDLAIKTSLESGYIVSSYGSSLYLRPILACSGGCSYWSARAVALAGFAGTATVGKEWLVYFQIWSIYSRSVASAVGLGQLGVGPLFFFKSAPITEAQMSFLHIDIPNKFNPASQRQSPRFFPKSAPRMPARTSLPLPVQQLLPLSQRADAHRLQQPADDTATVRVERSRRASSSTLVQASSRRPALSLHIVARKLSFSCQTTDFEVKQSANPL